MDSLLRGIGASEHPPGTKLSMVQAVASALGTAPETDLPPVLTVAIQWTLSNVGNAETAALGLAVAEGLAEHPKLELHLPPRLAETLAVSFGARCLPLLARFCAVLRRTPSPQAPVDKIAVAAAAAEFLSACPPGTEAGQAAEVAQWAVRDDEAATHALLRAVFTRLCLSALPDQGVPSPALGLVVGSTPLHYTSLLVPFIASPQCRSLPDAALRACVEAMAEWPLEGSPGDALQTDQAQPSSVDWLYSFLTALRVARRLAALLSAVPAAAVAISKQLLRPRARQAATGGPLLMWLLFFFSCLLGQLLTAHACPIGRCTSAPSLRLSARTRCLSCCPPLARAVPRLSYSDVRRLLHCTSSTGADSAVAVLITAAASS
mmetsp:Transcript_11855/g.34238  ORF Transcript_11855/g.34238 Transcript_11855/m.34238 type:complete len:377 (+) Transcript_11855:46-1176(+)